MYVDTVVDMPVAMHQQVPQFQTVPVTVDVPLVQSIGRESVPAITQVTKPVEIPPTPHTDKVVDVPAVMRRHFPQRQTARKTGLTMCQCLRSCTRSSRWGKAQEMVPRARISERISEQIVDGLVSHSQPQISEEVVEVVVPHIQTSRKTVEVLPAQFDGTVADVPLIRPINQVTRQTEIPPYQHIDEAPLCPPINQGTKHAEFPRTAATQ